MDSPKEKMQFGGKIEANGIKWESGSKASSEFEDAPAPKANIPTEPIKSALAHQSECD